MKTEVLVKLSNLNSNLKITLGYLNPALNNLAQRSKQINAKMPGKDLNVMIAHVRASKIDRQKRKSGRILSGILSKNYELESKKL